MNASLCAKKRCEHSLWLQGRRMGRRVSRAARGPYDLTTLLSRVGWIFLRPFAASLIRSRTLLPATVRLCGAAGDVVVYDAAMFHRGGANRADVARPILAIHVRPKPVT